MKKNQRKKDKYWGQAKRDSAVPNGEKQMNGSEQIFIIHFLETKDFWIYISTYHIPGESEPGKTTQSYNQVHMMIYKDEERNCEEWSKI